jgi:N-acetylglucosamine-6-sulfatase
MGNHRLHAGKRCPYEEDINIPLLIRGPDVAKGVTSDIINSHTDMAPTILQMLGIPLRDEFDGAPIAYKAKELGASDKTELVNVEFWNSGDKTPQAATPGSYSNNTYKALRLISDEYSFLYTKWCTGENEFYDMQNDPGQMQNRLASPPQGSSVTYYGRSEQKLFDRLDALLMVTKGCATDSCREPWNVLFPGGQVGNLTDAMRPEYDRFFAQQPKVSFSSCIQNHIVSEEGPQDVTPYGR